MIKEAYVSFEVAKLLKEKGFTEDTTWYYNSKGYCEPFSAWVSATPCDYSPMPTHQMACAWLRQVKNINIFILPLRKGYTYSLYNNTGALALKEVREYSTYENAVEAVLKYSLENLL